MLGEAETKDGEKELKKKERKRERERVKKITEPCAIISYLDHSSLRNPFGCPVSEEDTLLPVFPFESVCLFFRVL